jgi:phosphoribosylamine-glycine ligase
MEKVKPTILLIDQNEGLDLALAVARSLNEQVYYYIPWQVGDPKLWDSISGDGFPELIKIKDMAEVRDEVETIIFLDLGFSSTIVDLKEQGYHVYGCTPLIEKLETDRLYGKEKCIELGIKVTDYTVVKGMEGVVKYFEEHKGRHFVKIHLYRGMQETFSADSPESVKVILNNANFGIYADEIKFIIEPEAEGVEIGFDAFFCNGKFLKKHFATIEIKGTGNVGQFVDDSVFIDTFLNPITPFLAEQNFTGNLSCEGFWDGKNFKVMDICARVAYPCSQSWAFAIEDFGQFLLDLTADEAEDYKVKLPYQAHVDVYTDKKDTQKKITIDESKLDSKTKGVGFRRVVLTKDGYYFVPGDTLLAVGLGGGKSWQEALNNAIDAANSVSAIESYVPGNIVEQFTDKIEKAAKLGFKI